MKLRNYQLKLIEDVRKQFKLGKKRIVAVMPPGAGKTLTFADMAKKHVDLKEDNQVLFLVHRTELVDQAKETFKEFGLTDDKIFVDMVGSYKKYSHLKPTLILFDECHHAVSKTWYRVVEEYPTTPMVGLTATPKRLDGESLIKVFDGLAEGPDAKWLIENKYLSPYKWLAPKIDLDIKDKGKDFDLDDLTNQLLSSKIYGDISKHLDPTKKTIIYSPSIKFSKQLEKTFDFIKHFDGDTPAKERKQIVDDFKAGKIRALTNVDLIGEGFNVPDCDCVMLLRPTKSLTLFIQQSMRGMRYLPGKTATIIDMVGNVFEFGFPTLYKEWELEGKVTRPGRNSVDEVLCRRCEECMMVYPGINPICPYCEHDNKKTQRQIKIEKEVELQEIKEVKIQERKKAYTLDQLKEIEKARGYKPGWAYMVYNSRGGNRKNDKKRE